MADPSKYAAVWTQFMEFQRNTNERFQEEIIDVYEDRMRNSKKRKLRKRRNVGAKVATSASLLPIDESTSTSEAVKSAKVLPPIQEESSSSMLRTSQRSAAKRATELTSVQLRQTLNEKLRNPDVSKRGTSSSSLSLVKSTTKISEVCVDEVDKLNLPECKVVLSRCTDPFFADSLSSKDKSETLNNGFKMPLVPSRQSRLTSKVRSMKNTSIQVITEIPENNPVNDGNLNSKSCERPSDRTEVRNSVQTDNNSQIGSSISLSEGCQDKQPVHNETVDVSTANNDPRDGALVFKIPLKPDDLSKIQENTPKDIVPPATRPTRIRTKNRKYNEDEFLSESLISKKTSFASRTLHQPLPDVNSETVVTESADYETFDPPQKGKKRKSESDDNFTGRSSKIWVKTVLDVEQPVEEKTSGKPGDEASSSRTPESRSRTKTLAKPTVNNIIEIEPLQTEPNNDILPLETPKPEHRMTRTRTRELHKKKVLLMTPNSNIKGKENKSTVILKLLQTSEKKTKGTPLATNNTLFSPLAKVVHSTQKFDSSKKVENSTTKLYHREDAARLKKQELMKAQIEGAKRKRIEKELRQVAHKQAIEKKAKERLAKIQSDKEEKERIIAQNKKLKEEQLLQKKQTTEALLKEAEERRLKEEEAKQARIKKQEEEKKRQAEERMRQAEEARKLHEMRLAQEAKEKELSTKEAEKKKKIKLKQNVGSSYELTPGKDELPPKKPKNDDNYGLSDAGSGDSTDDEKRPKKVVPKWATRWSRKNMMMVQSAVHLDLISAFFPLHANIQKLEVTNVRCRQRASSAVWDTSAVAYID